MLYRLLLIPLFALLAACQSTIQTDYDPSRDFAAYHTWSWEEPAVRYYPDDPAIKSDLTDERVRMAVSQALEQRGLSQVLSGPSDLKVQVWLRVEVRHDSYTTYTGGMFWGYPGWWGGPSYAQTYQYDYRVGVLQIDLLDGRDGRLVWRGSEQEVLRSRQETPAERSQMLRQLATQILSKYPPQGR